MFNLHNIERCTLASSMSCQSGVDVCGPFFIVLRHGMLANCNSVSFIFHPCLYSESAYVNCSVYSIQ